MMFKFVRLVLWAGLVGWTLFSAYSGFSRTSELFELSRYGKFVNAQVIGQQKMPQAERMGFVEYAFNEGTFAVANKMPVPVAAYGDFYIGKPIPVTYLPENPHVVRIGAVTSGRVFWTAGAAVISALAGILAFSLALAGIYSLTHDTRKAPA